MRTSERRPARPLATPVADLIAELQVLDTAHELGDVKDKPYERRKQELLEAIGLAKVKARLAAGENVLVRHHYQQAHFPFTGVALRDVATQNTSFFATERRVFRWCFSDLPGRRQATLGADETLSWLPYAQLRTVTAGREYRWGEAAVAAGMMALSWLLWGYLEFSGPILMLVGAAGLAHALLVPTPFWTLAGRDAARAWRVYAAGQATAKTLVEAVRAGMGVR